MDERVGQYGFHTSGTKLIFLGDLAFLFSVCCTNLYVSGVPPDHIYQHGRDVRLY